MIVPVRGFAMAGGGWVVVVVWVWWGRVGVAQHRRVQHGGVLVVTWCMCCVYKTNVSRKQNYRRFDEGQFTKVGCKTKMSKPCIIVGYLGRTALDDDRAGGRVDGMGWCG